MTIAVFARRRIAALLWLAAIVLAPSPVCADSPADHRKIIIDDDGFGLMQLMLLRAPAVDVLGITTVTGDVWANRATAMALRGLELAGRTEVPVAQGATYPLINSEALTDRWEALYGKLTWRGAWMHHWVEPTQQAEPAYHGPDDPVSLPLGNPTTHAIAEPAALFLIRMVHKYPGQVTVLAAGPMTNLALAQRLDPQFAGLARELVYMGGSLNPRQVLDNRPAADFAREFSNSPRREFNFRFDPEAASIVAHSPWRHITAVPVDPSTATQQSEALVAGLEQVAPAPLKPWLELLPRDFPLWDEIAAAAWLDPALVREKERLYLDADTEFGPGYGDMLSWHEGYQPGLGEQQADVVRAIDVAGMEALIKKLVAGR